MRKYLSIFLLLIVSPIFGQIEVDFPRERMVIQRNNSNQATLYISGTFTVEYDSVRARLTPVAAGQGIATNWVKINTRNGKPYFSGSMVGTGGWYKLDVVAFKNGNPVGFDTVQKVGIGEVFVIAGQSNASGTTSGQINGDGAYVPGAGYGIDTNEDRCNVIHFANKYNDYNTLPLGFDQMSGASVGNDSIFIGPFQLGSWCWAKLSEKLVDSLNVPVLFYGAAFGGTKVQWWKESALEQNLTNPSFFVQQIYNHPYGALGSVLKYYTSLTGIRGVLWHQGESDGGTSTSDYQSYLQQVISQSRNHVESPSLAWLVARVSYTGGNTYSNVIAAQDAVIASDANVFAGPTTDNLGSIYRADNIHLDKPAAFLEHANYWFDRITKFSFLTNSTPVMAQNFVDVNMTCNPNNLTNALTLTSQSSFPNYAWSNRNNTTLEARGEASDYGQNYTIDPNASYQRLNWKYDSTSSITVSTGKYALNVIKPSGKRLFSPYINLSSFTSPSAPTLTSSATQVRPGDIATITGAGCASNNYVWNNLQTVNPISPIVNTNTSYTVQCQYLHCLSNNSASLSILASNCFPNALTLSGIVNNIQTPFKSKLNIESNQTLSSSGKIEYSAKNSILLSPGFKVDQGAVFKTNIEDCN